MGADAVAATYTDDRRVGAYMIEATTNPAITRALVSSAGAARLVLEESALVQVGNRWLAAVSFPLRDHLGKEGASRPPVGRVVAWLDVDAAVHAFERSQMVNIGFAVLAFGVVAVLIRLLLHVGTRRLEQEIARRTAEVEGLLARVSHLASRDPLTDLFNRVRSPSGCMPRSRGRGAAGRASAWSASISTGSSGSTTATAIPPATTCCA